MVEPIANPAADSGNDSRLGARLSRILIGILFGLLFLLAWQGLPFETLYVGCGLASAFLFQVALRPRRWEILGVLAGGGVLTLFDQFVVRRTQPDFHFGACLGYIGLVSFLVLGLRAVWAGREEQKQLRSILIPAAGFTVFILGTSKFLGLSAMLYPRTMDIYAYAFDGSLGFQPAFMVGQWFRDYPVLGGIGRDLYEALPLAMALVYAAYLRLKKTAPLLLLEIFMCAGLFGYFLYLMFPATGPVYLTGPRFPGSPTPFSAMRDLVLRGHVLARFTCPRKRPQRYALPAYDLGVIDGFQLQAIFSPARAAAVFFVFATVLGTLGTGEHYRRPGGSFSVRGFRTSSATRSVPLKSRNRLFPLLGGATLTLLWLVLLRFAIPLFFRWTPLVPWFCVIASTALSALWMKQILSVEQSEPQDTTRMVRAVAAGA